MERERERMRECVGEMEDGKGWKKKRREKEKKGREGQKKRFKSVQRPTVNMILESVPSPLSLLPTTHESLPASKISFARTTALSEVPP